MDTLPCVEIWTAWMKQCPCKHKAGESAPRQGAKSEVRKGSDVTATGVQHCDRQSEDCRVDQILAHLE